MPVRDREHEQADDDAEQPAARQCRQLHQEQKRQAHRERNAQAMAALQPQIHGEERQQRHAQHDGEVVRIARQRIGPVHGRASDRAVHVDRAGATRERCEQHVVEIHTSARRDQLEHAVRAICDEPERESRQRAPVERDRAAGEVRNGCSEEEEMKHELHHPLPPLVERLLRLDVEEPDQIDHEQQREEHEHDRGRAREARHAPLERERDQEQNRQHIGDADRAGDVPVDLLPRDAEERREEERAADSHASPRSTSASSSTRAPRPRRSRSSAESTVPSSVPAFHFACSSASAARRAGTSSAAATTPAPVSRISSAAAPDGGTAAKMGRSAARYSNTFPDSTPCPRPPASGMSRSNASESRCSARASRRDTYGCSSSRSPRPRLSAQSRSAARKSPTKRATTSSSPDSASAVRNGRGSRFPKKLPVCVMRKRSPRLYASPAKSSKSAPLRIVVTTPAGSSATASSAIASDAATITSAWRATRRATDSLTFSFARTDARSTRRWGCKAMESRRSATHRTPVVRFAAAPIKFTELGGEVVITTSIPSVRTIRTAAGIAVRFHATFSSGTSTRLERDRACRESLSSPRRPCSSSASLRARGPT